MNVAFQPDDFRDSRGYQLWTRAKLFDQSRLFDHQAKQHSYQADGFHFDKRAPRVVKSLIDDTMLDLLYFSLSREAWRAWKMRNVLFRQSNPVPHEMQSGGLTMFGYAVGGGLDYKWQLDAGSAVVLGVKYLHYGFGNNTLVLADNINGSGFSNAIDTKESVDVVTGRISWLFSFH